jgi:hypothetical protein
MMHVTCTWLHSLISNYHGMVACVSFKDGLVHHAGSSDFHIQHHHRGCHPWRLRRLWSRPVHAHRPSLPAASLLSALPHLQEPPAGSAAGPGRAAQQGQVLPGASTCARTSCRPAALSVQLYKDAGEKHPVIHVCMAACEAQIRNGRFPCIAVPRIG